MTITQAQTHQTTVRTQVVVDAPLERAFAVFTEGIGTWFPPEYNLLAVDIAERVFEPRVGGHVYDRGTDGSTCHWARVLAYEPPTRVVISWDINPQWQIERIRRKRAKSKCGSRPKGRIARASTWNIATSNSTGMAGCRCARGSVAKAAGRDASGATPSALPHKDNAMAPLVSAIDIARPPDEVFSYVTDPSRFVTWQENIVSGHMDGEHRPRVGSRCMTTRRIGFAEREITSEITAMDPPRRWAIRGIDGPIRATVNVTVEPLNGSTQSRVTVAIDFEGRGIGRLLVPLLVRREARHEMPRNMRRLKARLEGSQ